MKLFFKPSFFVVTGIVCLYLLSAGAAVAGGGNPLATTICAVISWFTTGNVGVGLASLSIFIIAIAAMMNKITWPMFIFASLDVVLIFGAAQIVDILGGMTC